MVSISLSASEALIMPVDGVSSRKVNEFSDAKGGSSMG
jgi:hypothetical protein